MSTDKNNKDVRINIRLTKKERQAFHDACKKKNTSISMEVRKYIKEQIK